MGCGSESSIILSVTNDLYSCGWNEHGNLGVVDCAGAEYVRSWKKQSHLDALLLRNPEMSADSCYVRIAANGAHVIAMIVPSKVDNAKNRKEV